MSALIAICASAGRSEYDKGASEIKCEGLSVM